MLLYPAENGLSGRVRTCDPVSPSHVRYQSALHLDGAGSRLRTHDILVTKEALYQLSYTGEKQKRRARPQGEPGAGLPRSERRRAW